NRRPDRVACVHANVVRDDRQHVAQVVRQFVALFAQAALTVVAAARIQSQPAAAVDVQFGCHAVDIDTHDVAAGIPDVMRCGYRLYGVEISHALFDSVAHPVVAEGGDSRSVLLSLAYYIAPSYCIP